MEKDWSKYEFIKRDSFGFFFVKEEYINYLQEVDSNVCKNKFESRPYIGIILEVNNNKYLAPLTSPYTIDDKGNKKEKVYLDFNKYKRIVHPINNREYGWVRVGNMIPVFRDVVEPIIIGELEDEGLKSRLQDQYLYFRNKDVRVKIEEQANKLYFKRYNNNNYYLADIMCDFKTLEELCKKYEDVFRNSKDNPDGLVEETENILKEDSTIVTSSAKKEKQENNKEDTKKSKPSGETKK